MLLCRLAGVLKTVPPEELKKSRAAERRITVEHKAKAHAHCMTFTQAQWALICPTKLDS